MQQAVCDSELTDRQPLSSSCITRVATNIWASLSQPRPIPHRFAAIRQTQYLPVGKLAAEVTHCYHSSSVSDTEA